MVGERPIGPEIEAFLVRPGATGLEGAEVDEPRPNNFVDRFVFKIFMPPPDLSFSISVLFGYQPFINRSKKLERTTVLEVQACDCASC
jgi:hypothetical protein